MINYFDKSFRKTAKINNTVLSYIDIGKGTPIVLIHGMALSSFSYRNTIEPLIKNDYRLILVDLPGHGDSIIPSDSFSFSIENLGFTVFSLIQKLNINKFHIVGHSMGGIISLYIATKYPKYIKSIVVINSPIFGTPHKMLLSYPFIGESMEMFLGKWMIRKYLSAMNFNDKKDAVAIQKYIKNSEKKGFWLMLTKFSNDIFSNEFIRMANNYQDFNIKTLILWGESDEWLSFKVAKKFDKKLPNSKLITFKDCGHNPHEECSQEVNNEIIDFFCN